MNLQKFICTFISFHSLFIKSKHKVKLPRDSPRLIKLVVVSTILSACGPSLIDGPKLAEDTLADSEGIRGVPGRLGDGRLPMLV